MQAIARAEYTIDTPPWVDGAAGTPMLPVDGAFDELVETVEAIINISGLSPGRHMVYVRGQDERDNWGVVSAQFIYTQAPVTLPVVFR